MWIEHPQQWQCPWMSSYDSLSVRAVQKSGNNQALKLWWVATREIKPAPERKEIKRIILFHPIHNSSSLFHASSSQNSHIIGLSEMHPSNFDLGEKLVDTALGRVCDWAAWRGPSQPQWCCDSAVFGCWAAGSDQFQPSVTLGSILWALQQLPHVLDTQGSMCRCPDTHVQFLSWKFGSLIKLSKVCLKAECYKQILKGD